jgi:Uma2 family endonuclease
MNDMLTPATIPVSQRGEPAWEVAMLFPAQGEWTEDEYLALDTNRLVELVDGVIEVHPMPAPLHQMIVAYLYETLKAFVKAHGLGHVFFSPLPVRLGLGRYREPDVVFLQPARLTDLKSYPEGADLVMEVVSEGAANRDRDLQKKPAEYAAAGIAEYWIVDPEKETITILALDGARYREHGVFRRGETASSLRLPGFTVSVDAALDARS